MHSTLLFAMATISISTLAGCATLGERSPLLGVERAAVFQAAEYPVGDWNPAGLEYEDATFAAADGTKLHGWFVPHEDPIGVALFCHGNGGNITLHANTLRMLSARHGLSVLTFDYRGYGRSEGEPSEEGILQDARAARAWLAQRTGVPPSEVIMVGESLGGAVAIDLAVRDGSKALILASTFTSLPEVGAHHVPWLLPRWNMTMWLNSLRKIPHYKGPILISHGDADKVVPFAHGERLFAAATGEKYFFRSPGAGHNDPLPEEYHEQLAAFLKRLSQGELASR